MARVCIVFGLLLCGLTMGGLILASQKNPAHFVPMMLGIPILFCGVVGLNPHRLGTSLRFAIGIAMIGVTLGGFQIGVGCVRLGRDHHVNILAMKVVTMMTILCLALAAVCLFSIVRTRRRRIAGVGLSLDPSSKGDISAGGQNGDAA